MHTRNPTRGRSGMSSGDSPPWAILVSHADEMLKIQRQMLAMMTETQIMIRQQMGTTKRDLLERAQLLLKECGGRTAAIARRLGIPRKTLDGWEEFRKVRDEYARLEAADKAKRARQLTGVSESDLDPDEGDDE